MTGQPAVWLRFFGCNLECAGFGQKNPTDPSTYELPYKTFDETSVTRVEDLPVWTKGCDSSYSWAAKYKHLAHDASVTEVCNRLIDQLRSPSNPDGLFVHPVTRQSYIMSFTGGEPMLNQPAMIDILDEFRRRGNFPEIVNVETNATRPLSPDLYDTIKWFAVYGRWHWSMSPKLFSVSGEQDVVRPEIIKSYLEHNNSTAVLKFVINGSDACWAELDQYRAELRRSMQNWGPKIWVMPVGATLEDQSKPEIGEMCTEAMKRGYYVAARLQAYIYGNAIGR